MWKFALCLSLVSVSALADGLIKVPDSAVVKADPNAPFAAPYPAKVPGVKVSPLGDIWNKSDASDYAERLPKALDGAPQAAYEAYFNTLIEKQKQTEIRRAMVVIPVNVSPPIKCLNTPDAFGYEHVAENDYRVNCFAGTGKDITHVAEYRMHVDFVPADCGTQAKFKSYFSTTDARTRLKAAVLYKQLEQNCRVAAVPVDRLNPVSKKTSISTDFVKKTLQENAELDKYVNGSHEQKHITVYSADDDVPVKSVKKKPAKSEDDEDEVPVKTSKRKPAKSDDDEEDAPAKPASAPCFAGNPFCKSTDAK